MQYSRFEQLVIGLGAISILGALALSMQNGGPGYVEIAAQVMLLGVLIAAVHWGRRGGLIAAIVASVLYILFRIPALSSDAGFTVEALAYLVVRIAAYGLVGIVGGEVCTRIKYVFARFDDSNTIDDWSRVYNQHHASRALDLARARYTRYGEPFSLVVVTLSPALFAGVSPSRQRSLVRAVAKYLRDDIRMVDEVSRLDDGRFTVMLPHTPQDGGQVVNERLAAGVRKTLGARSESVTSVCLGAAEDTVALATLNDGLREEDSSEVPQD